MGETLSVPTWILGSSLTTPVAISSAVKMRAGCSVRAAGGGRRAGSAKPSTAATVQHSATSLRIMLFLFPPWRSVWMIIQREKAGV